MPLFQYGLNHLRLPPDLIISILNSAIEIPNLAHDTQTLILDYNSKGPVEEPGRRLRIRKSVRKRQRIIYKKLRRVCRTFYGVTTKAMWEYLAPTAKAAFLVYNEATSFPIQNVHTLPRGQTFGSLCTTLDLSDASETGKFSNVPLNLSKRFPNIKFFVAFEVHPYVTARATAISRTITLLKNLPQWAQLEGLYQVNAQGEENLEAGLASLPCLKTLEISRGAMTDNMINQLQLMMNWTPGLSSLIFSDSAEISWESLQTIVNSFPQLKILDIGVTPEVEPNMEIDLAAFSSILPPGLEHFGFHKPFYVKQECTVKNTLNSLLTRCPKLKIFHTHWCHINAQLLVNILSLSSQDQSPPHAVKAEDVKPDIKPSNLQSHPHRLQLERLSLTMIASWESKPTEQESDKTYEHCCLGWSGKEILMVCKLVTQAVQDRGEEFNLNMLRRVNNFMKMQETR